MDLMNFQKVINAENAYRQAIIDYIKESVNETNSEELFLYKNMGLPLEVGSFIANKIVCKKDVPPYVTYQMSKHSNEHEKFFLNNLSLDVLKDILTFVRISLYKMRDSKDLTKDSPNVMGIMESELVHLFEVKEVNVYTYRIPIEFPLTIYTNKIVFGVQSVEVCFSKKGAYVVLRSDRYSNILTFKELDYNSAIHLYKYFERNPFGIR